MHAATERTTPDKPQAAQPDRGGLTLAVILAAVAGWVDAVGFVQWHGLFVSFMSGNTTQTAAAVGSDWPTVVASGRAVLIFVVGVTAGELTASACGRWGRTAVLLVEAALLWLGVWASLGGQGEAVTASVLGLAMGIQNASVHEAGGISVALTYVTGTLVKIGRGIAGALRGDGRWSAIPPYLALWFGLLIGALGGGGMARLSEPGAVVVAAASVTALGVFAARAAVSP